MHRRSPTANRPFPAGSVASAIRAEIDRRRERIAAVCEELYRHPELSGEEVRSCRLLADLLGAEGFRIEVGLAGLPTAFRAVAAGARPGPRVALLAEYDALPGIGHGCGHNLIAGAAVGAALGLLPLLRRIAGEVVVVGTPAEETIGGKAILAEAGIFRRLDAAMMIHPSGEDRVYTTSLAAATWEIEYHGRAAHAVVHPEKGINALDALVDLYRSTADLAAAAGDGARLPGVIREGGQRPNLVPERAVGEFSMRARSLPGLERLRERFLERARGIATRSGCRLEARQIGRTYREMRTNRVLADRFKRYFKDLGRTTEDGRRTRMGSLDMGNVSQLVPSIHPFIAAVPPEVASHTAEFARATVSDAGRAALLDSSLALALTAADLYLEAGFRRAVRGAFDSGAGEET